MATSTNAGNWIVDVKTGGGPKPKTKEVIEEVKKAEDPIVIAPAKARTVTEDAATVAQHLFDHNDPASSSGSRTAEGAEADIGQALEDKYLSNDLYDFGNQFQNKFFRRQSCLPDMVHK